NLIYARTSADQLEAHRRFTENYARGDVNRAVGSDSPEHWLAFGQTQFDYLVDAGLQPGHRVLELGFGNLRLGWRLIEFLDAGNYVGLEISPLMVREARNKVVEHALQPKRPY